MLISCAATTADPTCNARGQRGVYPSIKQKIQLKVGHHRSSDSSTAHIEAENPRPGAYIYSYNSLHLIGLGGVIFAFVRYFASDDDEQQSEGGGPADQATTDGKAPSSGREDDTAASVQGALLCLTSASLALQDANS